MHLDVETVEVYEADLGKGKVSFQVPPGIPMSQVKMHFACMSSKEKRLLYDEAQTVIEAHPGARVTFELYRKSPQNAREMNLGV